MKFIDVTSPDSVALLFFVIFVSTTVFFILYNANFSLGDDAEILTTICKGIPHEGLLYQNPSGRFNWSRSEYNILLLTPFFHSPFAYYFLTAAEFIIFSYSCFSILRLYLDGKRSSQTSGFFLYGICLLTVLFQARLFFILVRPEKLLVTLLAVLICFLLRSREPDEYGHTRIRKGRTCMMRVARQCLPFIIAFVICFSKEPVFGALLVLAGYILLFMRSNIRLRVFAVWLVIVSVLYISLYAVLVFPKITGRYGKTNYSFAQSLMLTMRCCPFLVFPLGLSLAVLARNVKDLLAGTFKPCLEDALLFSGTAYAVAFFILRMSHDDYFRPCFIMALPAFLLYGKKVHAINPSGRWVAVVLCWLLCAFYMGKLIGLAARRVKYGSQDMDSMKEVARRIDGKSRFLCYDNGSDSAVTCMLHSMPAFISYINGTDCSDFTFVPAVPALDSRDVYVISWGSIPEYEGSGYQKLPITIFHVYRLRD